MTSRNLAIERRPTTFAGLRGQPYATNRIVTALETNQHPSSLLFVGPSGCGKTSLAQLYAMAQLCTQRTGVDPCGTCKSCQGVIHRTHTDYKFVDGTSDRSLAFIKDQLIIFMEAQPWHAPRRVLVIDEAHQYRSDAIQAFLTVLEALPQRGPHTTVIFCTTEPMKIPITIRNRCLVLNFSQLDDAELIEAALTELPELSDDALEALLEEADGSMRTLYSIIDKLAGTEPTEEAIRRQAGVLTKSEQQGLWQALEAAQYPKALAIWHSASERKLEYDKVSEQVLKEMTLRMADQPDWPGWMPALQAVGFASVYNKRHHWAAAFLALLRVPGTAAPQPAPAGTSEAQNKQALEVKDPKAIRELLFAGL